MKARHAAEIRRGILLARDVIGRQRRAPQFVHAMNDPRQPLLQRAYNRELTAMVRDGRIRPPRGSSVTSRRR